MQIKHFGYLFYGENFLVHNGDGIVPADAAEDPAIQQVITDIIALFGAETDRSGKPGVNQAKTDAFFAAAAAYLEWAGKASADPAILLHHVNIVNHCHVPP